MSGAPDDTYKDGMVVDAQLGDFLSRPIKIAEETWEVGQDFNYAIDLWTTWQNNPVIKAKLQNYYLLRCKLKLRVMLNGTPFHYGNTLIGYVPYGTQNSIWQYQWDTVRITNGNQRETTMSYLSTCPHMWINPADNNVIEMDIPFVWHKNWIDITSTVKESLGSLHMMDVAPLQKASDTAADKINFSLYLWAEDVELCVPTNLAPTSGNTSCDYTENGDEYNDGGVVSNLASAVASGAGKLKNIPVIGPYARATEIGAGAIGHIARIFGFSNPSQIHDTHYYKQQPYRNFAQVQGQDTALKLSFDPKQEVTVDPMVTGTGGVDEMTFDSIVDREMWLVAARWTPNAGANQSSGQIAVDRTLLFQMNVTPMVYKFGGDLGGDPNYQTWQPCPAALIGRLFDVYRCSITYRIQVIASRYHSGRLKVAFDPAQNTNIQNTETRLTEILDLSSSREVEITVDYVSSYPYLETGDIEETFAPTNGLATTNTAVLANFDKTKHVGVLTVTLVNDLVAPNASPAYVQVFMKVNKGAEFNIPSEKFRDDLYLPTSGGEELSTNQEGFTDVQLVKAVNDENRNKVFFGERMVSLRSLLHRANLGLLFTTNFAIDTNNVMVKTLHEQTPRFRRASNTGSWRMTYEAYLSNAFLLKRGGARWRYVHRVEDPLSQNAIAKGDNFLIASRKWTSGVPTYTVTVTDLEDNSLMQERFESGITGTSITYINNNVGLEAEYPYYNPTRFTLCQHADYSTVNPSELGTQYCEMTFTGSHVNKRILALYFSTAEDYMLHFFLAAPTIYKLP